MPLVSAIQPKCPPTGLKESEEHKHFIATYGKEEVKRAASPDWVCPRCQKRCNCSVCMNKDGLTPTGRIRNGTPQSSVESGKPGTSQSEPNAAAVDRMRKKIEMAECAQEQLWDLKMQESLLPKGTILKNVAGVALKTEDVGPALQFLELCRTFSQVLRIKDGQPKRILEEIANYKAAGREQAGNAWLIAIKKLLSNQPFFKDLPPSFFKSSSRYHDLNSTWKLQILNLLCDSALPAKLIIEARNKLKNEVAKSREPPVDGIVQPFEQEPCELSLLGLKEKLREACCEMLDALKDAKLDQKRDARRPEPLMPDGSGGTYWKMNGYVEGSSILLQDVGNWNPSESNNNSDKWFFFSKDEEKNIETHCFSRRVWESILESALKQDPADERDQGAHDEAMEVSSDEEESDDETTEYESDTDYSLNEEPRWEDELGPGDVMEAYLYEEELGKEPTESESDTDTSPYEEAQLEDEKEPGDAMQASSSEEESDDETTEPESDFNDSLYEEGQSEDEDKPEDAMETSSYGYESDDETTDSYSDPDNSL
ncbi:Zinc-finger domain of monoamine-oxidase A repressor R1 protein [Rhynchospora pubera]|uniref:Zinc-finger domain of monoamine-oxidase A repressor R1 protein n=1 Tax=Rhynchospora pubera TaxID=906938 RepID=A0AAV8DRS9_9POAL|nr:Zinc-finger domain of monoamine-oxidase A repressor R1 protein [Rhynchospora pubera]